MSIFYIYCDIATGHLLVVRTGDRRRCETVWKMWLATKRVIHWCVKNNVEIPEFHCFLTFRWLLKKRGKNKCPDNDKSIVVANCAHVSLRHILVSRSNEGIKHPIYIPVSSSTKFAVNLINGFSANPRKLVRSIKGQKTTWIERKKWSCIIFYVSHQRPFHFPYFFYLFFY